MAVAAALMERRGKINRRMLTCDDHAGVDKDGFSPRPERRERDIPVTESKAQRSDQSNSFQRIGHLCYPPLTLSLNLSETHMRPGTRLALPRYLKRGTNRCHLCSILNLQDASGFIDLFPTRSGWWSNLVAHYSSTRILMCIPQSMRVDDGLH